MTAKLIDFHTHVIAPHWPLITALTGPEAARRRWEAINARMVDRAAWMEDIESGDLAGRVLCSPAEFVIPQHETPPPDTLARLNDEMAARVAEAPGRLWGLATIDPFAGEAGAREAVRAVRELGLHGLFLPSAQGARDISDPVARPALAAAAELGVPVFLHPVTPEPLASDMGARFPRGVLLARGLTNGAGILGMVAAGVFEELPALRVVVTALSAGAMLTEAAFDAGAGAALARGQIFADTMGFHAPTIRALAEVLGPRQLIAGSDWPVLSTGPIRARALAAFAEAGLDAAAQAAVAGDTLRSLVTGPT